MAINPTGPAPNAPGATAAKPAAPAGEKKDPTKAAAPKTPKPKKEGAVARPRLPKFPDEHVITVLKEGAKARAAHDRFMEYKDGMTVKSYVDLIREKYSRTDGQTHADIRWDEDHKFIHVGPTVVPKPTPAPATQAAPAPKVA